MVLVTPTAWLVLAASAVGTEPSPTELLLRANQAAIDAFGNFSVAIIGEEVTPGRIAGETVVVQQEQTWHVGPGAEAVQHMIHSAANRAAEDGPMFHWTVRNRDFTASLDRYDFRAAPAVEIGDRTVVGTLGPPTPGLLGSDPGQSLMFRFFSRFDAELPPPTLTTLAGEADEVRYEPATPTWDGRELPSLTVLWRGRGVEDRTQVWLDPARNGLVTEMRIVRGDDPNTGHWWVEEFRDVGAGRFFPVRIRIDILADGVVYPVHNRTRVTDLTVDEADTAGHFGYPFPANVLVRDRRPNGFACHIWGPNGKPAHSFRTNHDTQVWLVNNGFRKPGAAPPLVAGLHSSPWPFVVGGITVLLVVVGLFRWRRSRNAA